MTPEQEAIEAFIQKLAITPDDAAEIVDGVWYWIFWDEESQSVKTEIVPREDVLSPTV